MLAPIRSRLFWSLLSVFLVAAVLPVAAQVNGAPPSVTSMGFGGKFVNGVAPSVTSMGREGYGNSLPFLGNCCANYLWPANPNAILTTHHRHRRDRDSATVGIIEPVYIPYAVPYATDEEEDSADNSYDDGTDPPPVVARTRKSYAHGDPGTDGITSEARAQGVTSQLGSSQVVPAQLVSSQPATLLVFKDRHQSDVVNYAIVGDTLFDFGGGRTKKIPLTDLDLSATHKANDDRGIDFEIPGIDLGQ
jgi:hypothetical protein